MTEPQPRDGRPATRDVPSWSLSHRYLLPRIGLAVGVFAALPQFLSPPFHTAPANEVVDHVVPGIVVLLVSIWAIAYGRHDGRGVSSMFVAGMVIVLAGLWMVATHVPLLAQASRNEAPWPASIYHCASALAVMAFGVIWSVWYWDPDPARGRPKPAA